MTRNRLLAQSAVAALLAVGGVGTAQAVPSYAYAELGFTNFILSGIVGPTGAPLAGVSNLVTSVTMTDGANYPASVPGGGSDTGNLVSGADVLQATSGPGGFPGQNIFTQQLLGSSVTRGDGFISGAIASGATSDLVAEGRLTIGPGSAGSSAGSSTTLQASFDATAGLIVELKFNASDFLTSSVGVVGDSANAQTSASYKIHDTTNNTDVCITDVIHGGCSTSVAPTELNQNVATTDPTTPQTFTSPSTAYDFSATLTAGHHYQITLADSTTTILSTVPEPVSIGLLGTGIFALGIVRRRKKA